MNPSTPLVADRRYEVQCESSGSRPNAIITWYKGKRQLRRAKVSIKNLLFLFHKFSALSRYKALLFTMYAKHYIVYNACER